MWNCERGGAAPRPVLCRRGLACGVCQRMQAGEAGGVARASRSVRSSQSHGARDIGESPRCTCPSARAPRRVDRHDDRLAARRPEHADIVKVGAALAGANLVADPPVRGTPARSSRVAGLAGDHPVDQPLARAQAQHVARTPRAAGSSASRPAGGVARIAGGRPRQLDLPAVEPADHCRRWCGRRR